MIQPSEARSPEQVAQERAMAHVSSVLTNLDWTLDRARKGLKDLRKSGDDQGRNAELALVDLINELERARKRFFQDTYFPSDTARLL